MATKTRPVDNRHCFEGLGKGYWLDKARGMQPSIVRGNDGSRTEYDADPIDGLVQQNGGIISPRFAKLDAGKYYFRFLSTQVYRVYGRDSYAGNWWVDDEIFMNMRSQAENSGEPLEKLAARRLALPRTWSDCAFVAGALLTTPIYCWAGRGKVAHAKYSPSTAKRVRDGELYGDAAHLSIRQLFIPGERKELQRYFALQGIKPARDIRGSFFTS